MLLSACCYVHACYLSANCTSDGEASLRERLRLIVRNNFRMATYQLYDICRILNKEIQSSVGFVKFNHQLCEHLAGKYSDAFENLDAGYGSDSSVWVSGCEPALKELRRLMFDGRRLVEACKKEDWWKRAIIYADDAAFDERVYCHLLQFLGCVDSLRAVLAEATTNLCSSAKPNFTLEDIDEAELHAEITEIGKEDKKFLEIELEKMLWDPLAAFLNAKLTNPLQPVEMKKTEIEWPAYSEKDLGHGASGKVQQCLWHGEVVAVKSMIDVQDRSTLGKEAAVWQGLSHPHLVKMVGCNGLQEESDFIVMELMGKDLGKWVKERSEPPIWLIVLDIILQIAQGIRYLHSPKNHHRHAVDKVIHRDLKPENFLLTKATEPEHAESAGHVKVKVADFGLSKTKELISRFKTKAVGTTRYTAMEILRLRLRKGDDDSRSRDAESESYTWSSDVWSFAMSVSEILTGEQPFFGEQVGTSATFLSKLEQGWRPALPSGIPSYFAELINKCWDETPSKRPSFIDICDMLLFCKNTSLRGSMPSKVASINEYNARKFIRHLGGEWCLHEGCLRHELISLDTYYEVLSESEKRECCRTLVVLGKGYGDWTCPAPNPDQVKRAVKLFQFAVNKFNDPEAFWRLGLSFEFGLGTEVNMAKAIANYEIASKLGFAPADVELGLCYSMGRGVPVDLDVAADHWKNALRSREEAHAWEGVEVDSIRELIQHTKSWLEAEGRRKKEGGKKENGTRSLQRLIEITSQLSEGRRLVAGHNCGNISDLVEAAPKSKCDAMRNLLKNLSKDKEINKSILSFRPKFGLWLKWLCAVLFLWAVYSLCT